MYVCEILDKNGTFEVEGEAGKAKFQKFSVSQVQTLHMPDFYKEAILKADMRINPPIKGYSL
jgi:hypothetical protein